MNINIKLFFIAFVVFILLIPLCFIVSGCGGGGGSGSAGTVSTQTGSTQDGQPVVPAPPGPSAPTVSPTPTIPPLPPSPPAIKSTQYDRQQPLSGKNKDAQSTDLSAHWNSISFPFDSLTSTSGFTHQLYTWDGSNYQLINPDNANLIDCARGFWAYCDTPTTVSANGSYTGSITSVTLHQGWNTFGFPQREAKKFSEITMTYNGETRILKDATSLNTDHPTSWAFGRIFYFNNNSWQMLKCDNGNNEFVPWKGYWIWSWVDGVTLNFYTPTYTSKYAYVDTWPGNNPKRPTVLAIDTKTFNIVSGTDIGIELNTFNTERLLPSNSLALSPDNRYLYAVDCNSISIIDTQTNTIRNIVEFDGIIPPMAISQDGNKIYITHKTITGENIAYDILVFNASNSTITDTISLDQNSIPIGSISAILNSPYVYISRISINGFISILDTRSNTIIGDIQVGLKPYDIAITPDGRYAYIVNHGYFLFDDKSFPSSERKKGWFDPVPGSISVIDTLTNTVVATININGLLYEIAIANNGSGTVYAYVTGWDIAASKNVINIINTANNTIINTIPMEQFSLLSCPAITPDGAYLYIGGSTQANTHSIGIISTSTNSLLNTIPINSAPLDIVIQK